MRSIKYCLNKQLADICLQALKLEELSSKIYKLLPEHLAPYCQVGSFNKGYLILTTTDAVWASQLRYLLPELRDKLRAEGGIYNLTSIKIDIKPSPLVLSKQTNISPKPLSDASRETIIRESQSCSYKPLREALLALGGH